MLEPDGRQPSGVDEPPISVQRKGSRIVGIDDDGDDLPNARVSAVAEQGVEQSAADAAADRVGAPGTPSPPRCGGMRAASSTVRSRRSRRPHRRESQSGTANLRVTVETAQPLGPIGRVSSNVATRLHVVGIDLTDRVEVIGAPA